MNYQTTEKRNKFIEVDVNRASFGEASVKAIYELYRVYTGCTAAQIQKITFRDMVIYLRNFYSKPNEYRKI